MNVIERPPSLDKHWITNRNRAQLVKGIWSNRPIHIQRQRWESESVSGKHWAQDRRRDESQQTVQRIRWDMKLWPFCTRRAHTYRKRTSQLYHTSANKLRFSSLNTLFIICLVCSNTIFLFHLTFFSSLDCQVQKRNWNVSIVVRFNNNWLDFKQIQMHRN